MDGFCSLIIISATEESSPEHLCAIRGIFGNKNVRADRVPDIGNRKVRGNIIRVRVRSRVGVAINCSAGNSRTVICIGSSHSEIIGDRAGVCCKNQNGVNDERKILVVCSKLKCDLRITDFKFIGDFFNFSVYDLVGVRFIFNDFS